MIRKRQKLQQQMKPLSPSEPKPRLSLLEARRISESIDCSDVSGLRDRALICLMFHNHLRPAQALGIRHSDLFQKDGLFYLRIYPLRWNRDGIILPLFPEAEQAVSAFLEMASLTSDLDGPLFRAVDPKTGGVTTKRLTARAAHVSVNRRVVRAGVKREISLDEFRVAGVPLLRTQSETYDL